MINVNNKKAISNLSKKSLKSKRLRNIIAVIAITLTATLFMGVFTIGGSIMSTIQQETMRQVGTSAHGGFKLITEEQYDILCQDSKIKDMSYNIYIANAENPELNKTYTEIRYTEKKAAEWNFSMPTTGRLPEKGLEIATSTAVLDALGIPHKLGAQVPLTFKANGITYEETFTLCGYYEADIAVYANEAYVSREYCDKVAPVLQVPLYEQDQADSSYNAGGINPVIWFSNSWDIEQKMADLKERCGFDERVNEGVNWAYAESDIDGSSIAIMASVLLLILLSGYLIIYNVFYISVSQDIRFYGLLKTIGTTGKQLKKIVHRQAFFLCLVGIPLGLIVGYLCGSFLMPFVMKISNYDQNYVVSSSPFIFLAAAVFSFITVWISCIRPCRLAAKVSAIEAVRYTDVSSKNKKKLRKSKKVSPFSMAMAGLNRNKKKTAVVVLSLTLSLILFNGTYTLVKGFDINKYLENTAITDFMVTDASILNVSSQEKVNDGVTDGVLENINDLNGLEGMGCVYMQEALHVVEEDNYQGISELVDKYLASGDLEHPYVDSDLQRFQENHQVCAHLYGIDEYLWDKLEVSDNETFDKEKFATGDYVIASVFRDEQTDKFYDVGDKVTLDFGNGKTKEYTVLALGTIPSAMGPRHGHYIGVDFTLPADEYLKQMGDKNPLSAGFDVTDEYSSDTEAWLEDYCQNVESSLTYTSRDIYIEEFRDIQNVFTIVGGGLSFVLGIIGLLNFVNAVVTSILARRREFAMLQSVGMTGKQLKKMLIYEGLFYAVFTIILALTLGNVFTYLIIETLSQQMWFFAYHIRVLPFLLSVPILAVISVVVPVLTNKTLAKQSIVERLRNID